MSTELKSRRDTNTNLMSTTPAQAEFGMDTTNARAILGDGSKAGGHPITMWMDLQGQKFNAITAGGTADAVTLTFATQLAPGAYAAHQRFSFIASATNTTTATININALGAKTIKKIVGGAKANLVAGDITSGLPYDIYYDGTDFVLMGGGGGLADGSVTNAKLEDAAAGDYLIHEAKADNALSPPGTTYIKVAEIIVPRDGTYRVRIAVSASGGVFIYGRAYVDGTAAGTEKSTLTSTYAYQNDDIAVNAGQLVQLYVRAINPAHAWNNANPPKIALCELDPIQGGHLYTMDDEWS